MHCKAKANRCRGIMECFCDCERCLEADTLASEVEAGIGHEEIESPATTDHFESQDDE